MTRDEAVLELKRDAGFRATQDATIIAALKSAQRTLERGKTLPSFLMNYTLELPVVAGAQFVNLPDRFIRLHDEYDPFYINTGGAKVWIPRKNFTEAYQAYIATGTDPNAIIDTSMVPYPSAFVLFNKTRAVLIPTPAVSFTLYLIFYQGALVLDSNIENAWLANAPDYLIGEAGMMVAGTLRDKDMLVAAKMRRDRGAQAYLGDVIEDELAGRPLLMGRNN